jgi:hypothetical protein
MLEAEGWKVWWDNSLIIGDDFRKVMTELGFHEQSHRQLILEHPRRPFERCW